MSLTAFLPPTLLSGLSDVSVSPGSAQNGYPLTWDNSLGKWVASNVIAGVSIRVGAGTNTQAIGSSANSTGASWIAQGSGAGQSNTTGSFWTALGADAGRANTTGAAWTALGADAGRANTTGAAWMAQGFNAGVNNTTGLAWIASGILAGLSNTVGDYWIAQGSNAGRFNTTGSYWFAQGGLAGFSNTTGSSWIAQGFNAGVNNTTGSHWVAQGTNAGFSNTTGSNWIAQGFEAGYSNLTGSNWIAQGFEAGYFEERGSTWHIGVERAKSLVVGRFDTNCIYLGHAGPITNAATCPNPTAAAHLAASTTARASLRIDSGVAPTAPNDGDIWFDGTNLKFRISTNTRDILTSAGGTLADAANIAIGTTTGTKFGTATTQKIGFYNATPVVQPSAVADLTTTFTENAVTANGSVTIANGNSPTVSEVLEYCVELEAKLEALLSRVRDLGLIAT